MKNNIPDVSSEKGVRLSNAIESFSTRTSVVKLGIKILEAIIYLKEQGVYYSVLTPSDIIVYESGDVVIQATTQRVQEKNEEFTHLVQLYTAPEAYDGALAEVSVLYSIGTIMYKLLNGGLEPFRLSMDSESAAAAYKLRMSGTRLSAPQNADALLSAIILKACEYNVSRRYIYPEDMLEELRLLADGNYQRKPRQEVIPEPEHEEKRPIRWGVIISAILSALLCVGVFTLVANYVVRGTYIKAERYMRDDKFEKAREVFSGITWYKDAEERLLECDYREAEHMAESGKIDEALEIFEQLNKLGYAGVREKLDSALLAKAKKLSTEGRKEEAIQIITSVAAGNSDEAEDLLEDSQFDTATELYKNGKFAEAREIFKALGDKEMLDECDYRLALGSMENGNYTTAMSIFSYLDGYGESDRNFALCEEWLLEENKNNGFFSGAGGNLGMYSDSDGYYVEYSMDGDKLKSRYTLPYERGKFFKVEDGVHYHSKSGNSWEKQWIYEYETASLVKVYNYIDNRVYTLETE